MATTETHKQLLAYKTDGFDQDITKRMQFFQAHKNVPIKFVYTKLKNGVSQSNYSKKSSEEGASRPIPKQGKQSFPNPLTFFVEGQGDLTMIYTEKYGLFDAQKQLIKEGMLVKNAVVNPIHFDGFELVLTGAAHPLKLIEFMLYAAKYRPELVEEVNTKANLAASSENADVVMNMLQTISDLEALENGGRDILLRRAEELNVGDDTRVHMTAKEIGGLFKTRILGEQTLFVDQWNKKYTHILETIEEAREAGVFKFNGKNKSYQYVNDAGDFIDGDIIYTLPEKDLSAKFSAFLRNEYLTQNETALRELKRRIAEKTVMQ